MTKIKAIIQPFMLHLVIEELREMSGLPGVVVLEVRGFGKDRDRDHQENVVENSPDYTKMARLEIVVPDDLVELVLETIEAHAVTGRPGDAKVFVSPVDVVVQIRTEDHRTQAV
jgi:nitrogen regulatory protein P-II 1